MESVKDVLQTLPTVPGGVGVEWVVQKRSEWGNSLTDFGRGRNETYDGLILDHALVPDMVASGALLDLMPYIANGRWQQTWPGVLSSLRWHVSTPDKDAVYMLPLGAAAMVLHYRSDVLAAHGLAVPRTWEQLIYTVQTVHNRPHGSSGPYDSGFYGFCSLSFAACHADAYELLAIWASFCQTSGLQQGAFFDPATLKPLVENAGMAAALLYYRQLVSYGPPRELNATTTCNSMYGTAGLLYEAGACAFQIASHPMHKRNKITAASAAVRSSSRVAHLPGATVVWDRDKERLVPCTRVTCPFAQVVPQWPGDAAMQAQVLSGNAYGNAYGSGGSAFIKVGALPAGDDGTGDSGSGGAKVLANMAPVLGLSPLALGINAFTSRVKQAYSVQWLRRMTDPETLWKLVTAPSTPLSPFRYEHFSPSNRYMWRDAGYDADTIDDYLDLSYDILEHGNLLSFPLRLQRFVLYRSALHHAAYDSTTSNRSIDALMHEMYVTLSVPYGALMSVYGTLRLQYLVSIGRDDLLAAPAPPPPPPPPDKRNYLGNAHTMYGATKHSVGASVGAALGSVGAAGLLMLFALLYKQLMVKRGWGLSKDPGVGHRTTLVVTDIEASTVLWEMIDAGVMDAALNLHHDTIRRVIAQCGGYESVTEGDSFTVAFRDAEAAVGFTLYMQSELMDQPWPEEVLMHEACRPVYVVSTKRLKQLTAKAAARTAAAESALGPLDLDAAAGVLASGQGGTSGINASAPSFRTYYRASRQGDRMSGLSKHVRRNMSFISRSASSSVTAGGGRGSSLLSAALAGGGSGPCGGGLGRFCSAVEAGPGTYGRGSMGVGGGGLASAPQTVDSTATAHSFLLGDTTGGQCDAALVSSRNLFDNLLPYSGGGGGGVSAAARVGASPSLAAAFAGGSSAPSLSLKRLPTGGLRAAAAAAAGAAPGGGICPSAPVSFDDRTNRHGLCQFDIVDPSDAPMSSGPEQDQPTHGPAASNGPRIAALIAGGAGGLGSGIGGVGVGSASLLSGPAEALSCHGSGRRTFPNRHIESVPEEAPAAVEVVRRTRSTVVIASFEDAAGAAAAAAVAAGAPAFSVARCSASGSGMIPSRGPLRLSLQVEEPGGPARRPTRLTEAPPPLLRVPDESDIQPYPNHHLQAAGVAATGGGGGGGRAAEGPNVYAPEGQQPSVQELSFLRELRRRQPYLEDEQQPGPGGRALRGWRSWTDLSMSILSRVQRNFRQATGGTKASFTSSRVGAGGGEDSDGVAAAAAAAAAAADAGGAIALNPSAGGGESQNAAAWDVESRTSSQSRETPNINTSNGTNILNGAIANHIRRRKLGGRVLYASPATYGSEIRGSWSELPDGLVDVDPVSIGAVLVFRGFRVRCGMHSGVHTSGEVNRNHPSGRTRYSGPALLCAKAISDAANGGMVFASRLTVELCSAPFLASRVVLWRLGDHVLGSPRLPASLFQLSNTALVLRAVLQPPLTRVYMPLGLGLLDAPLGVAACVAIKLASSSLLENEPPSVSMEAACVFQALTYQFARIHGGYLAELGVGRALCVFGDAYGAALWAAKIQQHMFQHPWSRELLGTESCRPRSLRDTQGNEVFIARGPCIKAVVHFGPVSTMLHPLTGQLTYEGGAADYAMRLLGGLGPNGVVATLEAAASLRRYRPPNGIHQAAVALSGCKNSNRALQLQPGALARQADVDGLVAADGTGTNSHRSSGAAMWRDSGPRRQQLHPMYDTQQYGGLCSSVEHVAQSPGAAGAGAGPVAAAAAAGSGGDSSSCTAACGSPFGGITARLMMPRQAFGPVSGPAVDGVNVGFGGSADVASPGWRRDELRSSMGRPFPRAPSPNIPYTDSGNTSGTSGTEGVGGGAGSGSRQGSQLDSGISAGVGGGGSASRTGAVRFSLNMGLASPPRPRRAAAASAAAGSIGAGGRAAGTMADLRADRGPYARGAATGTAGGAGPPVATVAASGAACGVTGDSLLLLLTMSGELPTACAGLGSLAYATLTYGNMLMMAAASTGGSGGGGGVRLDRGTTSGSGTIAQTGWMTGTAKSDIDAAKPTSATASWRGSAAAGGDIRPQPLCTQMMPALASAAGLLPPRSGSSNTLPSPLKPQTSGVQEGSPAAVALRSLQGARVSSAPPSSPNTTQLPSRSRATLGSCNIVEAVGDVVSTAGASDAAADSSSPTRRPRPPVSNESGQLNGGQKALSPTQLSDGADGSSDPDIVSPVAPMQRPPTQWNLRQQQIALDPAAHTTQTVVRGSPQRSYQSFTFGQRGSTMVRPRLQDLLAVSPYATSGAQAGVGSPALASAEIQLASDAAGAGAGAGRRDGNARVSRSQAAAYGTYGGRGGVEGGSAVSPPSSSRIGSGMWGVPSGGGGPGSLDALIRGPNGRISRSFTFTTHRRSPLAVSSYAGDPEIGSTVVPGTHAAGGASSSIRPMSGLSRVLYGAAAAVGVIGRDAAATAASGGNGDGTSGDGGGGTLPIPMPIPMAVGGGAGRVGRRDAGGLPSSWLSLSARARRASAAHQLSGVLDAPVASGVGPGHTAVPIAASGLVTGPQPSSWALLCSTQVECLHSSTGPNSAGNNSGQLRSSTDDLRGTGTDSRVSGASGTASRSVCLEVRGAARAAMGPGGTGGAATAASASAAGRCSSGPFGVASQVSGFLSRVRLSMPRSRSRSHSRSLTRNLPSGSHLDILVGQHTRGSSPRPMESSGSMTADAMLASSDMPSASGVSMCLATASAQPSGSSGGGAGGSRTLRGVVAVDKLPTLPESGVAPLLREILHLQLRLVPLRLTAHGGAVKGAAGLAAAEAAEHTAAVKAAERAAAARAAGSPRGQQQQAGQRQALQQPARQQLQAGGHQQRHGQSRTGRAAEVIQVYRVLLVEPKPHLSVGAMMPNSTSLTGPVSSQSQIQPQNPTQSQFQDQIPGQALRRTQTLSGQTQAQALPENLTQGQPQPQMHPAQGQFEAHAQAFQVPSESQIQIQISATQVLCTKASQADNPSPVQTDTQTQVQAQPQASVHIKSSSQIQNPGPASEIQIQVGTGPGTGSDAEPSPRERAAVAAAGVPSVGRAAHLHVAPTTQAAAAVDGASGGEEDSDADQEAGLVAQFLSGFADLSDPQLAVLWAVHPERSLLRDCRLADVVQLRAKLAVQETHVELYERDGFLF